MGNVNFGTGQSPEEAVLEAQAAAAAAAASAATATTEAGIATDEANSALASATLANSYLTQIQTLAATAVYPIFVSTTAGIQNGVKSTTGIVGGSGGTNGQFDIAFSGGGATVQATGRFVVSSGALVAILITSPGYGYSSAPTMSFAASTGLTGASATAIIGANTVVGGYFYTPTTDPGLLNFYRVDAGPVATLLGQVPTASSFTANPAFVVPIGRQFAFVGPVNITQTALNTWTRPSGTATISLTFQLTPADIAERDAGRPVTLRIPYTGTWAPTYRMYAGVSPIGSPVAMTNDSTNGEYYATITLDPTCTALNISGNSSTVTTFNRPYLVYQNEILLRSPTQAWYEQQEVWNNATPDTWSRNLLNSDGWTATFGSAPTPSQDGRTVTVPVGTICVTNCYIHGAVVAGEYVTVVVEALSMPGFNLRNITATGYNQGGFGGTAVAFQAKYGNYFFVQALATASAGSNPHYIKIQLDNRTLDSSYTAASVELRIAGVFKGAGNIKSLLDQPGVMSALAVRNDLAAFVDPGQTASGSNFFTSLMPAYLAGYGEINLADAHYRLSLGLAVAGKVKIGRSVGAAETGSKPIISAGIQIVPASLTPTGADAHVYYYPLATVPTSSASGWAMWEVVTATGATTHLGIPPATSANLYLWRIAASEARANVGSYWWGAGSEGTGIYIRPYGDTTTGKVWEYPGYQTMTACNSDLTLDHVDMRYSTNSCIEVIAGILRTNGITTGYCNYDGAFFSKGAQWYDVQDPSLATETFNDGWGAETLTTNNVVWALGSTKANGCCSDGFAPHGSGGTSNGYIYISSIGSLQANNNGKDGFVTICPGYYNFDIESSGCRAYAVYFVMNPGTTGLTEIYGRTWITDSIAITIPAGSESLIIGRVDKIQSRGTNPNRALLNLQCNVTFGVIEGYGGDFSGTIGAFPCVRLDGGSVTIDRLFAMRYSEGVYLTAGTLGILSGHVLRNTTGLKQTGGTFNLNANSPINVYGNTTQFTGVSGADQAKTVSFNMT
jgi:hypothetical protein